MRVFRWLKVLSATGVILACAHGSARSAPVVSDRLRITDQAGVVQFNMTTNESVPEFLISTAGTAILVPTGTVAPSAITLTEPDGTYSDVIRMQVIVIGANDNLLFTLRPDTENGPPLTPLGTQLPEMNGEQEYTKQLFGVNNVANAPYRVYVTSDADPTPEPSTIVGAAAAVLFGLGYRWLKRPRT